MLYVLCPVNGGVPGTSIFVACVIFCLRRDRNTENTAIERTDHEIKIDGGWSSGSDDMSVECAAAQSGHLAKSESLHIGRPVQHGRQAKVSLLEYQAEQPEMRDLFKHLKEDGKWVVRDDAWINFLNRKGNLTVGFGSPKCIGPELEFGNTVADHFHEQGRVGLWLSLSRKRDYIFEDRQGFWPSDAGTDGCKEIVPSIGAAVGAEFVIWAM